MDLLSDWLQSSCDVGEDFTESSANLWAAWQNYAKEEGLFHLISSANSLSRRLTSRGFLRLRGEGCRGFKGLKLKKSLTEF